jgi:alpha-tubulin suppressor-like RCC1 family protein
LTILDTDNVGNLLMIELLEGSELVQTLSDTTLRTFTGLDSNTTYTIKVTYRYDLNDGNRDVYIVTTSNINTSLSDETFASVSLGGRHTSVLTNYGRMFLFGNNQSGQVGTGFFGSEDVGINVTEIYYNALEDDETFEKISVFGSRSSVITSKGNVLVWGYNNVGQLGDGTQVDRNAPVNITDKFDLSENEKISNINFGVNHSVALTSSGRIFTWGSNNVGQLGNGTISSSPQLTPVEITEMINLSVGDYIKSISSGNDATIILTVNGEVWVWGDNSFGRLGNDSTESYSDTPINITNQFGLNSGEMISLVEFGYEYSAASLTSNGRVFTWGYNRFGRLGDGTNISSKKPIDITSRFALPNNEVITSVALGMYHSSAITNLGRMFTWGYNVQGQLGNGTTNRRVTPTDITDKFNLALNEKIIQVTLGMYHSSALTSDGRLFMWGSNERISLGVATNPINRLTPLDITYLFNLSTVS